jgi:hypothetical protein
MDLPGNLIEPFKQTTEIINGFLQWISFCAMDTGRDPEYVKNHLLYVLVDDYLESLVAAPLLIKEGIHRTVIRDARFLLEMSIKMAYIQQSEYRLPIETKISSFNKELSSPSISIMKKIKLGLIKEELMPDFYEETGRLFGYSSKYIHLTPEQIKSRILLIEAGRSLGKEDACDLWKLNSFLERIYAVSIVYIMHSVPCYISGDWLVESNGETTNWYFLASKFIAAIDEHFDYKHERQSRLDEIKKIRKQKIRF